MNSQVFEQWLSFKTEDVRSYRLAGSSVLAVELWQRMGLFQGLFHQGLPPPGTSTFHHTDPYRHDYPEFHPLADAQETMAILRGTPDSYLADVG